MKQKNRNLIGGILLGIGSLGGCATLQNDFLNNKYENYYSNEVLSKIDNSSGLVSKLNDREFVVPDDVFYAYSTTVDKSISGNISSSVGSYPLGGYFSLNYLDTFSEISEFSKKLEELSLSSDDINMYNWLFREKDVIIFREEALLKENFDKLIRHERLHKEFKTLDRGTYNYMMDVAKELLDRKYDDINPLVKERNDSEYRGGFAFMYSHFNKEEFFTYLTQGEFLSRVKETLKNDFPKAHRILNELYNRTEIN